ncbi:SDR family oxidoreductase [Nocardia gamkensis]|uniref:SDR family oxidoreductase n=1 Tax=Nocardia gamkensis TaxID=352869 RepID=A0A7X6L4T8_9NOCA|nr:SDR family oxidoreductase [Nocardia gamkensis]NKY27854.1 SDR family oxidoreductase [Nocardia gamkensis]NQE67499.1 putative short-chain type dehydrogenase/reductase y4vI [Nocardia gamkensis]
MRNRVVIVGGTSGIGLAAARRFASGGHDVVIAGRDAGRLEAALAELGENVTGRTVDARDEAELARFFTELGPIDHVVVTVTGPPGTTPFRELALDHLREHVEGKLLAHTAVVQAALPHLAQRGSITLVSAASAGGSMPTTAALAAVNSAVEAMVPVLAVELAPLRVNAVSPGVIDTEWWSFLPDGARAEVFDSIAAATPVGRVGTADDVAQAIEFLVGNSFTTGIVMRVDGGARLGAPK